MMVQKLSIGCGAAIYLETPEGLVILRRLEKGHFEVTLPGDMKAHKVADRATGRFLERTEDGRIVPVYAMLQPTVDAETGELTGVRKPPVLRMVKTG